MADSDSGTHVTDISESFPDDFEPREEGKRHSHSIWRIFKPWCTNLLISTLCPVPKYSLVKTILILPRNSFYGHKFL